MNSLTRLIGFCSILTLALISEYAGAVPTAGTAFFVQVIPELPSPTCRKISYLKLENKTDVILTG